LQALCDYPHSSRSIGRRGRCAAVWPAEPSAGIRFGEIVKRLQQGSLGDLVRCGDPADIPCADPLPRRQDPIRFGDGDAQPGRRAGHVTRRMTPDRCSDPVSTDSPGLH